MTVGELKAALEGMDDGLQVVLSRYSVGTSFAPVDGAIEGLYDPELAVTGPFIDEDDVPRNREINAVCLYPVN